MVKMTTEEFIIKARKVHGGKYDYSKAQYVDAKTKVCIVCPEHGGFWQIPSSHLKGRDCPACAKEKRTKTRKLNLGILSFNEAKIFIKDFCLRSRQEYRNIYEKQLKDAGLPKYPETAYRKNWCGWNDFLSCNKHTNQTKFLDYDEAQKIASSLGLKSQKEWIEYTKSKEFNNEIPKCPQNVYKNKGWKSWGVWLGTEYINNANRIYLSYSEAKKIVSRFQIKSVREYTDFSKTKEFPKNLPKQPQHYYKEEWVSWNEFLGTNNCHRPATDEFISNSKSVHGNKYDYSKVKYINAKTKVCIICPTHGEFWQIPSSHLKSNGCPKCTFPNTNMSSEEFVIKAKQVHGDKYDYSKVKYVNIKTKVCIICPKHGEFWQSPENHLSGKGCQNCNGLTKQYKFNLLEEFESEYAFRAFLENHDINILLSILMNIEPKYEPLKKDIERALVHANEINPIQSLREKYSSDAEESDDDDYLDDTDTTDTDDFDWDNDDEVNDMISQETETDTDTDDELTIDDIIRNDEEEIRVINRLDSEHLITPEVREYIKAKYKNDMMRAWMAKRDNK